jgi:hypothetical protein
MTTVIEMAREVKATAYTNRHYPDRTTYTFGPEQLERFAELVADAATEEANRRANASWTLMCEKMVTAEREACAKVCDELANDENTDEYINAADWCAVRIRARGETK